MITKVLKNDLCTGCGLCQSIIAGHKVEVKLNNEGYYRPIILDEVTRDEFKIFRKVCPALSIRKDKENAPINDAIWGEMYACYIGAATDDTIRDQASSGGAISAILIYLLESKMIDAVVHIGASTKQLYKNEVKISKTVHDIVKNANSRYSPSAPLIDILNILTESDRFAFVGKPCDVAALKQYSLINNIIDDKIKLFISFFCAGVPSLNATKSIVESFNLELSKIKSLHYRKDGWPGSFKVTDQNNNMYELTYNESWMKRLGPHIQFRCKICADGIGEFADITCADAWSDFDEKGFPTFKNDTGRSLIIPRSKKGREILEDSIIKGHIKIIKKINNLREIDKMQPGQLSKKLYFIPRILALKILLRTTPVFSRNLYFKAATKANIITAIKNFIGSLKRSF